MLIEKTYVDSCAYVAGFFDAEGSITISKFKTKTNDRYQLQVRIANNDRKVLSWIKRMWGAGHIRRHSTAISAFELSFMARQAQNFLDSVVPYLLLKREEAQLGIQFQKSLIRTGGKFLSEKTLRGREGIKKRMTRLHKRNKLKIDTINRYGILPYLAGLIDGDGFIGILHKSTLTLTITSNNHEFISLLKNFFKIGFIYSRPKSKRWIISSGNAKEILIKILPYLKIKRIEAENGIKFQNSINPINRRKIDRREFLFRENLIRKIKSHHLGKGIAVRFH